MWICEHCKKEIDRTACFVELATYNIGNNADKEEHDYFHMACWKQYFESRVMSKSKNILGDIQGHVHNMFYNNPQMMSLMADIEKAQNGEFIDEDEFKTKFIKKKEKEGKNKKKPKKENVKARKKV